MWFVFVNRCSLSLILIALYIRVLKVYDYFSTILIFCFIISSQFVSFNSFCEAARRPEANWNFCLLIALLCMAQFLLITVDCSNLIIRLGLFISKLVLTRLYALDMF